MHALPHCIRNQSDHIFFPHTILPKMNMVHNYHVVKV
jgi:hypothetical protein